MLIAKYTCNASGVVPTFNSGYVYEINETENNGIYTVEITSESDFSSCSFNGKSELLTVEYLKVTSKVTNMANMFYSCQNLTSIDVSNFNTSNVTNMYQMFNGCTNLTELNLSNFDTDKVTSMYGMFQNCTKLTSLDISNWNTNKVTSIQGMFFNCNNLTSIGLIYANIDTINQLPTLSTATLYIDTNIDQTAYTGSSKLKVYEQRTVTINIPTALRNNGEIADRIYWNDTDKHYYIEQNINPNTNETLETPNIIASGVKQPIYLKTYENELSVGISNIDASYMSINVPFFEIPTDYEYKWEDELDYIKQSFELRYPDEEDVPNGWGFMGCDNEEGTGLKALIDWVDNCKDEEFVADFDKHFLKDYTLRYYCLVILIGAVDNLGKNMMLDSADNKIFFPRFYDIDTICSYDNSGQLKFDVDIEMEQGYWNTSTSRLWTRMRELMHDDIVATYNNMRQNGISYENMMKYIYDEQIAKIPQSYYLKDYDVKYAPFADSYIGMANGDTYEHAKRWLTQRFRFCDSLFDYAPSYNNDVLTIRANTTELMTLEIETYTPVYQHLSWYNNQMDKKKIDGKVATEFSGKAMAATDQEVLIYGGSNVKSIKGIQSMNPNRMLIGSATRLTELDASNCPLLNDINANKANLSPHTYLNKLNLENCPLLDGNLRLNASPLIREINIKGTNISGLNLPSSLRSLEVMKLPKTLTGFTLNDATSLHTLDFEEGTVLNDVSMTNCNALTNVTNFDLSNAQQITLNNSYNTTNELYFKNASTLSLSNMDNLEKVIYTPNAEHETFDITNLTNTKDYNITTFNCPKLTTFMTTAPYRESYNNCGTTEINYTGPGYQTVLEEYNPNGEKFKHTLSNCIFDEDNGIEIEIDVSSCTGVNENIISIGEASINNYKTNGTYHFYYNIQNRLLQMYNGTTSVNTTITLENNENIVHIKFNKSGLFINDICYASYSYDDLINAILVGSEEGSNRSNATINHLRYYSSVTNTTIQAKDYGEVKPDEVFEANSIDISNTQFTDVKLLCTTDTNVLKLPQTVKNLIVDSAYDLDTNYLTDGDYDAIHTDLYEPYNADYEGEVVRLRNVVMTLKAADGTLSENMINNENINNLGQIDTHSSWARTDYIPCYPNTPVSIKTNIVTDNIRVVFYAKDKSFIEYNDETLNGSNSITSPLNTTYIIVAFRKDYSSVKPLKLVLTEPYTPNLIPSASDGSIIQSMYVPTKTVQPASGVWDLKGLELEEYHTFGLNNDVKIKYNYEYILIPNPNIKKYANAYGDYTQMRYNCIGIIDLSDATYSINVSDTSTTTMTSLGNISNYPADVKGTGYIAVSSSVSWISFTNKTTNRTCTIYLNQLKTGDRYGVDKTIYNTAQPLYSDVQEIATPYLTMPDRYDEYSLSIKNKTVKNEIARYTASDWNTFPTFNSEFTYTYDITKLDDEVYEYSIMADSMDNLPTSISFDGKNSLLTVEYLNVDNVTNMYRMFYNCNKLTSLDVSNFDTSKVTIMQSMFQGCTNLTSLDLSNFDTKNVTDMRNMFHCHNLTSLDVSNWDTSKVTNMSGMFYNCNKLTSLDVSNWNTSNVTDIRYMFNGCNNLTSLDVSNWNTSNVTDMEAMFQNCQKLTTIGDISNWNTNKVTSMYSMFNNCRALTFVDVSNFDISKAIVFSMFSNCRNLTSLDLSNWDTSNVTSMSNMFHECRNLTSIGDLSNWNTNKVTTMSNMFVNCNNLTSLDVSNWNTSKVTTMYGMFSDCKKITSLNASNWNTSKVTDMTYMFYGCASLQELHIESWELNDITQKGVSTLPVGDDKRNVIYATAYFTVPNGWTLYHALEIARYTTNTSGVLPTFNNQYSGYTTQELENEGIYTVRIATNSMDNLPTRISFNGKSSLLTVEYLNVDNVTDISWMFNGCNKLTSLNMSNWNTSNVTSMGLMFNGCNSLTSVDVSNLDTGNVTDMSYMFSGCANLTSLDLSNFDTSKVTDMKHMFYNCSNLASLDVSSWNTSEVTNMTNMFFSCNNLTSLDVSNFDTGKVTTMGGMFNNCSKLTSLDLMQNISVSLSLSSTKLDQASLVDIINNLATVTTTQTLELGTTLLAKLTEEQIAVAVSKGWSVA